MTDNSSLNNVDLNVNLSHLHASAKTVHENKEALAKWHADTEQVLIDSHGGWIGSSADKLKELHAHWQGRSKEHYTALHNHAEGITGAATIYSTSQEDAAASIKKASLDEA